MSQAPAPRHRLNAVIAVAAVTVGCVLCSGPGRAEGAQGAQTVALWLFDEPQYLNMTLTDAGRDWSDLRLLDAGELVPGRVGGCIGRRTGCGGQAVCYAEERKDYPEDAGVVSLGRPSASPAKLLGCLAEGDWTWEWWLRATGPLAPGACLVDAGQDAFQCSVPADGAGLAVLSAAQGVDVAVPADIERLGDGAWHHVALTWDGESRMLACYLDGKGQGAGRSADKRAWSRSPRPQYLPGLAGEVFANPDLTRSAGPETTRVLDFDMGGRRGTGWSERWRGWLTAPATGEVRFRVETDTGLKLMIGEASVIDGWTKDGARDGSAELVAGTRCPILVEYTHRTPDPAKLRLLWSWDGQGEQVVPSEALWHTPEDEGKPAGAYRFDLALLSEQGGGHPCDAQLDEMRVSRGVLYEGDFDPPGPLARNWGADAAPPAEPSGPPLLWGGGAPEGPLALGGRKHVFIDDALLSDCDGAAIRQCQPLRIEPLQVDFGMGDASVVDVGGRVWLYYGGWNEALRLAVSEDGLRFDRPDLGVTEFGGTTDGMGGNAVLKLPGQASVFIDGNPATRPEERFKAAAFIMTRGIYALTSADGIQWRRNETMLLPFDCGGGAEAFWDDQRGLYACHLRHEGHYPREGRVERLASLGESREFSKPWPFEPDPAPVPRGAFTLPALWHELPTPFFPNETGQVYRTRALKYEWAPDVYLAFVWRYDVDKQTRETELATSRDGRTWRFFGCSPAYLPVGTPFGDGLTAKGALSVYGLVRRGDQVWQYAELSTAGHSSGQQGSVRLTQRLDGFACLQADARGGTATSRPITFEGDALELNVQAGGEVRVGVLEDDGSAVPGFSTDDCEPIRGDSVRQRVRWRGGSLQPLHGRAVRLRFEMRDARLFALQFVTGESQRPGDAR